MRRWRWSRTAPGAAGSLWRDAATDAARQLDVAAQRVGRVDTTGAGDAFAAGFLFALARSASGPPDDMTGGADPVRGLTSSCGARRWPATRLPRRPCGAVARRSTRGERRPRGGKRARLAAMSQTTDPMRPTTDLLHIAPEVRAALDDGRAVVALESTITTHGLPRPDNLHAARAAEAAVRAAGAVPATVATRDGRILVGLEADELEALAAAEGIPKVSRQNLAAVLAAPGWGGTTVSATMIAAHLAGIEVFATGGIGGVHRGGEASMDISADLDELARTPVTVVCAGPKSILDVGRTLEALETRGVPVVGWQSDEVAGFYSRSSGHRAPSRVESAEQAARLIAIQRGLGLATRHPRHRAPAARTSRCRTMRSRRPSSRPRQRRPRPASTALPARPSSSAGWRPSRAAAAFAPTWRSSSGMLAWPARSRSSLADLRRAAGDLTLPDTGWGGTTTRTVALRPGPRLSDPDHSTGPRPPDVPCQPGAAGLSSRVAPSGLRAPASPGRHDVATGRSTEALDAHL